MARSRAGIARFGEKAAAVANWDLAIAVDSAVAYLSAAVGVPAWLLVYHPASWRWMTGRADSHWYPAVRLFRQVRAGEWAKPAADLVAAWAALP